MVLNRPVAECVTPGHHAGPGDRDVDAAATACAVRQSVVHAVFPTQ